MTSSLLLVTIPFSHYCEKARWALERAGLAFREEPHAPLFSRLATRRRGRWSSVPVLVTPDGPLTDSTEILAWIDARLPEHRRLFPDGDRASDVRSWEQRFDEELGPHTRRVAYDWVLPRRAVSLSLLRAGRIPRLESTVATLAFPLVRLIISRGLKVNPQSVDRSRQRVERLFDDVERALSDGRRYLTGDRFTAADLTFASLAAPVLAPPEYGGPLAARDQIGPQAESAIAGWRATPAGRFALRLYAEERRARG